jgi:MFS family permease
MSDGFVTVAQCVEGLPTGTFAWELLFCGFLAWFLLGAINEFTPMAFSFYALDKSSGEEDTMLMSAALALGNFLAIAVGGWIADRHGRTAVIRPSLLLTVASGTMMQAVSTFRQLLAWRFALGLSSGGLLSTVPALLAELLPSRNRGYYLTVWCSGWPAGALFAIFLSNLMPGLNWRFFYTVLLVPGVVLYVCSRADMLPESPRYLYLVGRRDEGYEVLADMYEKEELPLPWAAETISVTCSPQPCSSHLGPTDASEPTASSSFGPSGSGGLCEGSKTGSLCGCRSGCCGSEAFSVSATLGSTGVAIWLALTMFCVSSAAQCMKLWMPMMLEAQRADLSAPTAGKLSFGLGPLHPFHDSGLHPLGMVPEAYSSGPGLLQRLLNWQDYPWHFADGPAATSLLQQVRSPLMMNSVPDHGIVVVLVQAYVLQFIGVIACAYASTWIYRRRMVTSALPCAAVFTLAVLGAAAGPHGTAMLCGPLMGLQLAAQAAALNFLQVFATEHYPTSRRAKIVAMAMFAAQLGNFTVPVLSGFIVHRVSPTGAVLFFTALYVVAWILSLRLPLLSSREHMLHDVDKNDCRAVRKRDWPSYQAI